ncbi:MAG TPA: phosphotransferase [Candidatus Polarisedimenticolia bacterium]|nr:phosphotransferase [Candidatus Polarisedimenticolia bacterium]
MTSGQPSPPPISPPALALARRAVGPHVRVAEIAGDASTRRFYRLTGGASTMILMEHPGPLDDQSSFYSNLRIMTAIGAPVPRLIDRDDAAGLVLVEDLGEVTLQRHLTGKANPAGARALYRQACDLIVLFQREGMKATREGDFARRNALDRERFLAELDHFHRYFVVRLGAQQPAAGEEAILRSFYDDLAGACDRLPRVYCHRDFQSRNLMVRGGRLALIDFQDARQGPYTYDAASLLRDSSLDLEEGLVDDMLARLGQELSLPGEEFRRHFDLMALQRNIKDLGTFAYQATERGRREYLEYVPRTVRFVRNALLRDRRYDTPYAVLDRFILHHRA